MRVIVAALLMLGAFALAPAHAQELVVVVRATCVDARRAPHPASQTLGEREAPAGFEGELYRCLAGTNLRYDVDQAVQDCAASEALWFGDGALSCRTAIGHPREHDRELLRRFGAGEKLVRLAVDAAQVPQRPPANRYPYRRD